MSEQIKNSYIGIPLPESLFLSWAWQYMFATGNGRFPEARKETFPHITLYYLGGVDLNVFLYAQALIEKYASDILGSNILITGLKILGYRPQALVVGIKKTDELSYFRKIMENELPQYAEANMPFNPHLTIAELKTRRSIKRARRLVLKSSGGLFNNQPFPVESVKIFHNKSL